MSWRNTVSDPKEKKVFEALDGPDITWRTVSGVARQTGLAEAEVQEILNRYNPSMPRFANVPTASGSALVGLAERVGIKIDPKAENE